MTCELCGGDHSKEEDALVTKLLAHTRDKAELRKMIASHTTNALISFVLENKDVSVVDQFEKFIGFGLETYEAILHKLEVQ